MSPFFPFHTGVTDFPPREPFLRRLEFSFGPSLALRRAIAGRGFRARLINLLRARGSDQRRRLAWYGKMAASLAADRDFQRFFEGESTGLPQPLRVAAIQRLEPFRALLSDAEVNDLLAGPTSAATSEIAKGCPLGERPPVDSLICW